MHAIVVPRGNLFNKEPVNVCMDADMDFSDRTLIERNLPDEKASYCFLLIMKYWDSKLVRGRWSSQKKDYVNITDKEVTRNNEIIVAYRKFISYMKKSFKKHWNIKLTVKNATVKSMKNGAFIAPKYWASTGCYGHENLESIIMSHLIDTIDTVTKPDADLSILSESYLDFYKLASFILNPDAVIIQNTDECSKKDRKKMQRMVMSYVRKNKGMCFVDWPLGG
jgi:hypothetical protein